MKKNRRKPNLEMDKWFKTNSKNYTAQELLLIANTTFNEDMTDKQLRQYLWHHDFKYRFVNENKSHTNKPLPIGSERIKEDGMTQIKVGEKKWVYKQRKIYEDYYNVKLPEDVYVIFLDGDRTNFDIKNLKAVNRKYCSGLANYRESRTKEDTELLLVISKLNRKVKNLDEKSRR